MSKGRNFLFLIFLLTGGIRNGGRERCVCIGPQYCISLQVNKAFTRRYADRARGNERLSLGLERGRSKIPREGDATEHARFGSAIMGHSNMRHSGRRTLGQRVVSRAMKYLTS